MKHSHNSNNYLDVNIFHESNLKIIVTAKLRLCERDFT